MYNSCYDDHDIYASTEAKIVIIERVLSPPHESTTLAHTPRANAGVV